MLKKLVVIPILLSILIVASGCSQKKPEISSSLQGSAKEKSIINVSAITNGIECNILKDPQKRFECYKDYVRKKIGFLGCDRIENEKQKKDCYIAVSHHNMSHCELIKGKPVRGKQTKTNATYLCYSGVARALKDETLCNESFHTDLMDECYLDIALKKGETGICNSISKDDMAVMCFSQRALESSANACSEANNSRYDDDVRNLCYIEVAGMLGDIGTCSKISSAYWSGRCFVEMAVKTTDYTVCTHIEKRSFQDECFMKYANETDEIGVCDLMSSKEERYVCYRQIAVKKGNKSICENIDAVSLKFDCLIEIAKKTANTSICAEIDSHDDRVACFTEIAVETGDPSICYVMKTKVGNKNQCYTRVAVKKDDKSICEMISYEDDREACEGRFSK